MGYLKCLLVFVLASSTYAKAEEMKELEVKILEKCKETTQASQDAVEKFLKLEDLDESPEGKCLIKCGFQTFGTMHEDGTINNDKAREYFEAAFPENIEDAASIWAECQTTEVKGDDDCEYAHSLIKCFIVGKKEKKIKRAWK